MSYFGGNVRLSVSRIYFGRLKWSPSFNMKQVFVLRLNEICGYYSLALISHRSALFFSVERGTFLCVCAWPSLIIKHFGRRKQSKKAEQAEEETDQQMESNSGNTPTTKHYVQDERNLKSAATSLLVTASHLLLYLPALLLLGLQVRKQSIDVNQ